MDGEMSQREVQEIVDNRDYWLLFQHSNWVLISFTDRITARFGWNCNGQYTKYVTIRKEHMEFMRGLNPDVWDYWQ